jgi:nucleotide-binding universal stress UspA family protein
MKMTNHLALNTKSILVLTDFTSSALHAADYALHLALHLGANILLFHSYYVSVSASDALQVVDYESLAQDSTKNLHIESNRLKAKIKALAHPFIPEIICRSEGGGVAENVSNIIAEKKNVLMLVMGGIKAHNDDYINFGSQIKSVVSKALCPAVIVPEMEFIIP